MQISVQSAQKMSLRRPVARTARTKSASSQALMLVRSTGGLSPSSSASGGTVGLRLRATRFPNERPVKDGSQGVPLAQAKALVQYWESRYDWRRFESELNSFPNFQTWIDGLGIHFIHGRSPHPDALPILLTHGWPGSIAEFIKIIRPLTNPTEHGGRAHDAFHVVIPSLPGCGFSDEPTETGWNVFRIASAWS